MNVLSFSRSIASRILPVSHADHFISDSDVEEELRSHIALRADDLERSGMSSREANRRARIEFGSYVHYKEESHQALGSRVFETLLQDTRFALRILAKSPAFTIAAITTLALAIGANAVVFGILNGLVLRPLNVPQAETLYGSQYGDGAGWQSYPNYITLRDRNRSFEGPAAFNFVFCGLDTGGNPTSAMAFATSGNYFDVLRLKPYLGRFYHASDEHGPNSAPFVVLNYSFWHSHFHDDAKVVGRIVRLNKHPFTVLGVGPPRFQGTLLFISANFFLPIVNQGQVAEGFDLNERGNDHGVFEVFGHLKPGVTPAQAVADMNSVQAYLEHTYPKEVGHKPSTLDHVGLTAFTTPIRAFVAGLMLLSGLILLAACANLGSLFAAHAADRSREIALRLALGSSRNRILRQLLTEAMLISITGGSLGLAASVVLLRGLSTWQPFPAAPLHLPVSPDIRVYLVALLLAILSGILFAAVPVRLVLRSNPYEIVKAGPGSASSKRVTLRDVLLVIQIAICGVLVTSSMVAVRGLVRSLHSNLGFEPRNTMLVSVDLSMAGYSIDQFPIMQKRMIQAVQTIPEVEHAGFVNSYPPLVNAAASRGNIFRDETTDLKPANIAMSPYRYEVFPGYLEAAGTRLLAGRSFTWNDDKNSPGVAMVSQDFAGKMFGSVSNTTGKFIKLHDGRRVQIVGVFEDGKYLSMTEDQEPAIFLPALQSPASMAHLVVRSRRDPQQLAEAMRTKLHELDPGLPLDPETWDDLLTVVLFPARAATMALGTLGILGAILSITGIFGMAAYSVSRRLRELGIRVALGAQRTAVLHAALGRALMLLAIGSAAGLLLGLLATRVLSAIVYQATPRDPLVLAGVIVAMSLLGLIATWIPAQRALSVDPMMLLREE